MEPTQSHNQAFAIMRNGHRFGSIQKSSNGLRLNFITSADSDTESYYLFHLIMLYLRENRFKIGTSYYQARIAASSLKSNRKMRDD